MPNQSEVFQQIKVQEALSPGKGHYLTRQAYLEKLSNITGRNVIAYYSAFLSLHQPNLDLSVNEQDKNAFMATVHTMDRSKGLDLILHTPGADIAATESIVNYLQTMFNGDIRAIVPQISMSAGTMFALSCKSIILGNQSSLGPIDPQIGGVACKAVLEEFEKAHQSIKRDPSSIPLWQVIIGKYHPTFLNACQKAISWSEDLVTEWLENGMAKQDSALAKEIVRQFSDINLTKSHGRRFSKDKCISIGLNVESMEEDDELQDAILSLHHAYMHTMDQTRTIKIVENPKGAVYAKVSVS